MDKSELLQSGYLLISAIISIASDNPDYSKNWVVSDYIFAKALEKCKDNSFASKFYIATNVGGKASPEFSEMLSLLYCAGVISYEDYYKTFKVLPGHRFIGECIKKYSDDEWKDTIKFVECWREFCDLN